MFLEETRNLKIIKQILSKVFLRKCFKKKNPKVISYTQKYVFKKRFFQKIHVFKKRVFKNKMFS